MHRIKIIEDAHLDIDREKRKFIPEIVYSEGKSIEQLIDIASAFLDSKGYAILSRIGANRVEDLKRALGISDVRYYDKGKLLLIGDYKPDAIIKNGSVSIVSAGTSDVFVAEESFAILDILKVENIRKIYDVGVANIYRLLMYKDSLQASDVIIVVAGMEGALLSVVSGIVDKPVIGVPTSVGYGSHFGGLSPLLTMLNSCSFGTSVVNIDNGIGAGIFAYYILRLKEGL